MIRTQSEMKTVEILGFDVFDGELDDLEMDGSIVNTINAHSFCVAQRDPKFKEALRSGDLLLPDGIGIVWANYLINKRRIKKISGYDLFLCVLNKLNEKGGSCYFFGSSYKTLEKIKVRLQREYPRVKSSYFSPPFKDELTSAENEVMISMINSKNPDVLFIAMTAPKQEKWVLANHQELTPRMICTVGAVFDFYAGEVKRPGRFWVNVGLEWLIRFLREPKRLWRRNLISTPTFLYFLFKAYFNKNDK